MVNRFLLWATYMTGTAILWEQLQDVGRYAAYIVVIGFASLVFTLAANNRDTLRGDDDGT